MVQTSQAELCQPSLNKHSNGTVTTGSNDPHQRACYDMPTGPEEGLEEGQNIDKVCADVQHCM